MLWYHCTVDFYRQDGTHLGRRPIEPDWQPAREHAVFSAVRRGLLPPSASGCSAAVEPVWSGRLGAPYVDAFRIVVPAPGGAEVSDEVSLNYFSSIIQPAVASLVASGALAVGARFRYRVCAFAAPASMAGGFAVEEVATPLPLRAGSLSEFLAAARRSGPAVPDEMPVFIPQSVLDETMLAARAAPDIETGGVLIGHLLRDCDSHEIFAAVTAQIPARHATATATRLTFTPDTWSAVSAAIALRRQDELALSWFHSHTDWCRNCPPENRERCQLSNAALSADDCFFQRAVFNRAYQSALLLSDNRRTGMTWSFYGWDHGSIVRRGCHILEAGAGGACGPFRPS
jgi:hypothetical protein